MNLLEFFHTATSQNLFISESSISPTHDFRTPADLDEIIRQRRLLWCNMTGMQGLEVAREIRRIRADLPIAVTSGFPDLLMKNFALELRAMG